MHRRVGLALLALLAWVELAQGADPSIAAAKDPVGAAMAALFSGYPQRHHEAAGVLIQSGEVGIARLIDGFQKRPQYERGRIVWVLAQMGEPGHAAVKNLGRNALRDFMAYYQREGRGPGLTAAKSIAPDIMAFSIATLNGPGSDYEVYDVRQAVADVADEMFLPTLVACLQNGPRPRASAACAIALGRVDSLESVRALASALSSSDKEVRTAAAKSLITIGPRSVDSLSAAFLITRDPSVSTEVLKTLLQLREPGITTIERLGSSAVPSLMRLYLADTKSVYARKAVFVERVDPDLLRLFGLQRQPTVKELLRLFEEEPKARSHAIRLLSELDEPSDLSLFRRLLDDPNVLVRQTAIAALARRKGDEEARLILEFGRDKSWEVKDTVHWALVGMGDVASSILEEEIKSSRPDLKVLAVRALSSMGEPGLGRLRDSRPDSVPPLVQAFHELGSPEVDLAARRIAAKETEASLWKTADSNREEMIRMFARLVAVPRSDADVNDLDPRPWTPILLGELGDPCDWGRFIGAATALGHLREGAATDRLVHALRPHRCDGWTHGNISVDEAVAAALGRIGGPTAIAALVDAVENTDFDPNTRGAAAKALRGTQDPLAIKAAQEYEAAPFSMRRTALRRIREILALLLLGPVVVWYVRDAAGGSGARWIFLLGSLCCGGWLALMRGSDPQTASLLVIFVAAMALLGIVARLALSRIGDATKFSGSVARDFSLGAMYLTVGFVTMPLWYFLFAILVPFGLRF